MSGNASPALSISSSHISPPRATPKKNPLISLFSRNKSTDSSKKWKPRGLRAPVLILALAICWSLIAVLQYFLSKSQRDHGVIFAPRISDLPLRGTFLYQYFPTIVAVIFSIYWAWIDLDTKRIEPYYQLSKENGALGKDSLLLHYPFDFIPLVPLKALKNRHWPVFWASLTVLVVTWGLVPLQAGIFATRATSRVTTLPFERSTAFVPASDQLTRLTMKFTQTTYSVAVLNEKLTQYMARNYTVVPFRPSPKVATGTPASRLWSAPTTMYSLDLSCELATTDYVEGVLKWANSTDGCAWDLSINGNLIVDKLPINGAGYPDSQQVHIVRPFSAMYVGYWNHNGNADYYLDTGYTCPKTSNHTFYAAFTRNKIADTNPAQNVTAIYCTPMYYQQPVMATIDAVSLRPIKVDPLGPKESLDDNLFNSTNFEHLLNEGILANSEVRGDVIPSRTAPHYYESVIRANVSLGTGPRGLELIHDMAGLALTVGKRPMEDYLDWKVLSKSYADAYRLMFASAMKEILNQNFTTFDTMTGQIQTTSEAVVLEPVFVYIVEALLAVVSLSTIALLYLSLRQKKLLRSDPGTIAALMATVADNQPLLSDIGSLNCSAMDQMKGQLGKKRYKLVDNGSSMGIVELSSNVPNTINQPRRTPTNIAKPVRPVEFSWWMALPVVSFFITLAACLGVVFVKARVQGLPLPSSNVIVQNLLENYVPTAIATLIEPMWVLVNRLLCMLQPIEELQDCNVRAKDSIDLNYSSLPPQLVIFKALRSKHFVLASVCTMALLANLLAVTFSGLFNQDTIDIRHAAFLNQPFDFKFVQINGTVGPTDDVVNDGQFDISGAFAGGDGQDQFFVANSYLRQGSPLPAWTDETMFYMPFATNTSKQATGDRLEAKTRAFGATLECTSLKLDDSFQAEIIPSTSSGEATVNLTVTGNSGTTAQCTKNHRGIFTGPFANTTAYGSIQCLTGPVAMELSFALKAVENATQAESEVCMGSVVLGWLRSSNGTCGMDDVKFALNEQDAVFVHCRPKLTTGFATVQVDSVGRLQQTVKDLTRDDIVNENSTGIFSNDPSNLIGQSNKYLFYQLGAEWHNDSVTNENFINYFIMHSANTSRFLDPNQRIPSIDDIKRPLQKVYSLLFAIWIGSYMDRLLVSHPAESLPQLDGWRVVPEQRVVLSKPMFAIAEGILAIYIVAAILVYMRRPGRYLARMPTSIASVIALFAASAAVTDMRGTSYLSEKDRGKHLEKLDARYGYGSFVGGDDGRVHIGIERTPFVRRRAKSTWFERINSFRYRKTG